MFIGHFAPAMVAATHPKAPGLGTLFVAGQLLDFGFFGLALAGIEKFRITPGITEMVPLDLYDMPYTHSLLGSAIWAAAFALLIWLFTRNRTFPLIEMPLELAITFGALAFFVIRTRPIAPSSKFALVLLAILLAVFQAVNWFSPEPEAATPAMMITALIAFAVASAAAFLVGKTRMLKQV